MKVFSNMCVLGLVEENVFVDGLIKYISIYTIYMAIRYVRLMYRCLAISARN